MRDLCSAEIAQSLDRAGESPAWSDCAIQREPVTPTEHAGAFDRLGQVDVHATPPAIEMATAAAAWASGDRLTAA